MLRLHITVLAAAMLPVLFIPAAVAQATLGSISGRIADQSSAAIPGVTVTLTNLATAQTKVATTSADGYYIFSSLQPLLREPGGVCRFQVGGHAGNCPATRAGADAGFADERG